MEIITRTQEIVAKRLQCWPSQRLCILSVVRKVTRPAIVLRTTNLLTSTKEIVTRTRGISTNVSLVDRKEILQRTAGTMRRTRIKGLQIGNQKVLAGEV